VKRVFVDTGAFFAVLIPEDLHHERARAIFARASKEGWQLVTTNIVVIETHALLLNRAHGGRPSALAFLDVIESDTTSNVYVSRTKPPPSPSCAPMRTRRTPCATP
jgi:predicted nucleic acid-binding protein